MMANDQKEPLMEENADLRSRMQHKFNFQFLVFSLWPIWLHESVSQSSQARWPKVLCGFCSVKIYVSDCPGLLHKPFLCLDSSKPFSTCMPEHILPVTPYNSAEVWLIPGSLLWLPLLVCLVCLPQHPTCSLSLQLLDFIIITYFSLDKYFSIFLFLSS